VIVAAGFASLLLALQGAGAAPGPAPSPDHACAAPNVRPHTVFAARPMTASLPHGLSGTVLVLVRLDEHSHVVSASIYRSPSALLNAPALQSARLSKYQTLVRNCQPVGGSYLFEVIFDP
jgi:Gram-negative bacterial TonB protein C-terminal